MNSVRRDFSGFSKLRNQLNVLTTYKAQVGLFPETAYRENKRGITDNVSLGFQHEFGNPETKLPERSFIRGPLMTHLGPSLTVDWFSRIARLGAKRTVASLGRAGVDIIQEAFATGGFGTWAPLKPRTIQRKKSDRILIEHGEMRDAVTSKVV